MTTARRVVTRYRVAARAAGYYGWDADEDDRLEAPTELQRKIGKPEEDQDSSSQQRSVTLTGGVDLSDDYVTEASIYLEVRSVAGVDADDEGKFGYQNESVLYELSTGKKTWKAEGHGYSKSKLQHDFKEWAKAVSEADPEAAKDLGLPRS